MLQERDGDSVGRGQPNDVSLGGSHVDDVEAKLLQFSSNVQTIDSREERSSDFGSSHDEWDELHEPLVPTGVVFVVGSEVTEGDPPVAFGREESRVVKFLYKVFQVKSAVEAIGKSSCSKSASIGEW